MKTLFDSLFVLYCFIWTAVHYLRDIRYQLPFLNGYLTDLVAVPAMAHLSIVFSRYFIFRDRSYSYPLSYLMFIAAYTSFVLEYLMPKFSGLYTADPLDVVCYFAGAIFYHFVHASGTKTRFQHLRRINSKKIKIFTEETSSSYLRK